MVLSYNFFPYITVLSEELTASKVLIIFHILKIPPIPLSLSQTLFLRARPIYFKSPNWPPYLVASGTSVVRSILIIFLSSFSSRISYFRKLAKNQGSHPWHLLFLVSSLPINHRNLFLPERVRIHLLHCLHGHIQPYSPCHTNGQSDLSNIILL